MCASIVESLPCNNYPSRFQRATASHLWVISFKLEWMGSYSQVVIWHVSSAPNGHQFMVPLSYEQIQLLTRGLCIPVRWGSGGNLYCSFVSRNIGRMADEQTCQAIRNTH